MSDSIDVLIQMEKLNEVEMLRTENQNLKLENEKLRLLVWDLKRKIDVLEDYR